MTKVITIHLRHVLDSPRHLQSDPDHSVHDLVVLFLFRAVQYFIQHRPHLISGIHAVLQLEIRCFAYGHHIALGFIENAADLFEDSRIICGDDLLKDVEFDWRDPWLIVTKTITGRSSASTAVDACAGCGVR
jgi:hypothetical protein